jgi:hypothetical protein
VDHQPTLKKFPNTKAPVVCLYDTMQLNGNDETATMIRRALRIWPPVGYKTTKIVENLNEGFSSILLRKWFIRKKIKKLCDIFSFIVSNVQGNL